MPQENLIQTDVQASIIIERKPMHTKLSLPNSLAIAAAGLLILFLNGCSEKIDGRQVEVNQGLIYKLHSNDPFSGNITNYEPTKLGLMVHGGCNVEVNKGVLDGKAICLTENGFKFMEFAYKDGKQNGEAKIWDVNTKNLMVKFNVSNGYKTGIEEYYNPENNKLVRQTNWLNNSKEGIEKVWNITGDILLTSLTWENGKQTGFQKSGERENNYKNGEEVGTQRRYTLIDGDYENQKKYIAQQAASNLYKADYFVGLLGEGKYIMHDSEDDHRKAVEAQQKQIQDIQATTDQTACVLKKVDTYHAEKGELVAISDDMMQEWRNNCHK